MDDTNIKNLVAAIALEVVSQGHDSIVQDLEMNDGTHIVACVSVTSDQREASRVRRGMRLLLEAEGSNHVSTTVSGNG